MITWQKMKGREAWRVQEFPLFPLFIEKDITYRNKVVYTTRNGTYNTLEEAQKACLVFVKNELTNNTDSVRVRLSEFYSKEKKKWEVVVTSLYGHLYGVNYYIRLNKVSEVEAEHKGEKIYTRHKNRFLELCRKLGV